MEPGAWSHTQTRSFGAVCGTLGGEHFARSYRGGVEVVKDVVVEAGVHVATTFPGPGCVLQLETANAADGNNSEELQDEHGEVGRQRV